MRHPVLNTESIPTYLYLVIAPAVHAQRFDLRYVRSKLSVQRCATHAEEDPQAPTCPSRILCAAISASVVPGDSFDQVLQGALVAHLLALVHDGRHRGMVVVQSGSSMVKLGDAERTTAGVRFGRSETEFRLVNAVGLR